MKKILILILSLFLSMEIIAQSKEQLIEKTVFESITITTTSNENVIVTISSYINDLYLNINDLYLSFTGSEVQSLIKFLDVHIELLEKVKTAGLFDNSNRSIMTYTCKDGSSIDTSLKLKNEGLVVFYVRDKITFRLLNFNKQNLIDTRKAFSSAFEILKNLDSKSLDIDKFILEARISYFNSYIR